MPVDSVNAAHLKALEEMHEHFEGQSASALGPSMFTVAAGSDVVNDGPETSNLFIQQLYDRGLRSDEFNNATLQAFVSKLLPKFRDDVDFQAKASKAIEAGIWLSDGDVSLDVSPCGIKSGESMLTTFTWKANVGVLRDKKIRIDGFEDTNLTGFTVNGRDGSFSTRGRMTHWKRP